MIAPPREPYPVMRPSDHQPYRASLDWLDALSDDMADRFALLAEGLAHDTHANITTPSGQPFDGCPICWQRESIAFLLPRILGAARHGLVELVAE